MAVINLTPMNDKAIADEIGTLFRTLRLKKISPFKNSLKEPC